jgi:Fe-Mn family superoxide dismutase
MKINIENLSIDLKLYPLPFDSKTLLAFMSEETIEYHYNKHHRGYVNKCIDLFPNNQLSLIELLKNHVENEEGLIYFNLAQVFNHHVFWLCIENKPTTQEEKDFLSIHFGSYENFVKEFIHAGLKRFGSGWIWLLEINNKVKILTSMNGEIPKEVFLSTTNIISLCDVWEHAYYIDYRNDRKEYLEIFVKHLIKFHI